ncbi:hypothetical protein TELCIR_23360, partial [Teladorsagia circumcincta]
MYRGSTANIKMFDEDWEVDLRRGMRQGDCISPKLFSVVIDAVFRNLEWNEDIKIDGEMLTHLLYADDCILFASTTVELQRKLKELQVEAAK